jgi:hypothetical protein
VKTFDEVSKDQDISNDDSNKNSNINIDEKPETTEMKSGFKIGRNLKPDLHGFIRYPK